MIWKNASGVHQETWYDDGSGWKKAGGYDRPSCGYKQTSTAPASGAQVEFRIDCNNVTYSGTDIAVINPPRGFANVEAVPTNTSQTEDDDCNPCAPMIPSIVISRATTMLGYIFSHYRIYGCSIEDT